MSAFRPDIEGLRALSIALVIVYHYAGGWLPGGFIGVDVFYVISGYLITHSLIDQHIDGASLRENLFTFWSRRARRLLPNALLALTVVAAASVLWLSDVPLARLGSDVAGAAGYSINWVFVLRAVDYLRWDETDASALLNFWSLAVEEQFYLLWPLLLLGLWRATGRGERALRLTVGLALVLAGLSFAYALVVVRTHLTLAFFSSPARAWELLAGAALALQSRRAGGLPKALGAAPVWLGLAAVLTAAVAMSQGSRHPGWITLLPVLGTVLLLGAAGRVPSALPVRWLGSAPMRALGARSYSVYLWHWPVLILGSRWLPAGAPWAPPTLLALSLLLAEAAYRWVESPARWRWGRGAPPGRVLLLALTSSALVAAIGIGLREAAQSGARAGVLPTAPRGMAGLPSLQQVRNDLAVVYANGCHVGFQALAPAQGCRLGGAADAPAVLLFGDSHAAQWVPALQAVASAHGHALVAWTKSGCPSADVTVWVAATRSLYPECDAWREAVFARLAALRPALVVVSNLVGGATVIVDRATGERLSGAPAAAAFEAGIARTLQRLKDAGLAVVQMRDTPHPKPDATTCLFAQTDLSPCERTRAEAAPADAADLRAARAVGVPVWDLSGAICGPERCPLVVSAGAPPRPLVVYRDADHLTASFAATLAPALERLWSTQLPMAPAR